MGYYSNLYIKGKKEILEPFVSMANSTELGVNKLDSFSVDEQYFYATVHNIKWYDGYTDVDAYEAFFTKHRQNISILREGEDPSDIDRREADGVWIYWYRQVIVDDFGPMDQASTDEYVKQLQTTYPEYFI